MEKSNLIIINQQINKTKKFMMMCNNRRNSVLLHSYKKKKEWHLKNIIELQKKNAALLAAIMSWRASPKYWTQERSKCFWEHDVANSDDQFFKENFRMNRDSFEILCSKLGNISKKNTSYRNSIDLQKRVAIAIYALGSSAEYRSVANIFGVGKSTVCKIVLEFCKEVWKVLLPEYFDIFPLKREKIEECVRGFGKLGFPQCLGAIDGCHIEVKPHAEDDTDYYNYKGWYSTVLLALVDYRYRFLYVNIGSPGRCNDSYIYEKSLLKKEIERPIMRDMAKYISGELVPVTIMGDSAFRFSNAMMKPYPFNVEATQLEKNFNYSLSKCRRVVENAFGHLKARFRRIGKGIDNKVENAPAIIKACCALHNFLNDRNDKINEQWIRQMAGDKNSEQRQQPEHEDVLNDHETSAETIRKAISRYISSSMEVSAVGVDDRMDTSIGEELLSADDGISALISRDDSS